MTRMLCLAAAWALLSVAATADTPSDSPLPPAGFPGDRYETLWTQSPFAIATPETSASADYQLVGLAQFDGVSYASLVVTQTQEHFVLTSQNPVRGLTLISVSHDNHGALAIIGHAGERLALREEAAAAAPTPSPPGMTPAQVAPNNPFPLGSPVTGRKSHPRIYRPTVVVPPPPG